MKNLQIFKHVLTAELIKAQSENTDSFQHDMLWPTWLVSIPVGVGHLIPAKPVERARAALVMEADPERISRTAEQQAVGECLLEPLKI